VNLADLAVIALAALAAYRGWRRGMVGQLFELGGGFLGLVGGVYAGPRIAAMFTKQAGLEGAIISLIVVFVGLSGGQALGYYLGHKLGLLARGARMALVNSSLGSAFGVAVTLVSYWLVGSLLVQGPSREVAQELRRSTILGWVNNALPEPPNVLAYLRQYLDTSGFPQVFANLPRPVSPPVDLPSNAVARDAVRAAQESTVRVVAPACGGTQLGSGWIAARDLVITNAHVVAGSREGIQIQEQGADATLQGDVVLYDPDTDLAAVRVSGLTGPVLDLEESPQDRGTPGATLGYPGESDGELVARRAAVQSRYEAVGRDIYGQSSVTREIYELRSVVRQGDSGGPFVLPDGRVAGVVFAASTTDRDTGYALTGAEIAPDLAQAEARRTPVGTGSCTH
jgi:S1-C subfamily serine protease